MNLHRLVTIFAIWICSGLLTALPFCAVSQQKANNSAVKIQQFEQRYSSSLLFAHFDKTIYTNNDNVWFTAYLLNSAQPDLHNTLAVALVNDLDKTVIIQKKFVMKQGIAFGNILLPDTIAPGNYNFLIYTNRLINNKPEALFQQPITIKTTSVSNFNAVLFVPDPTVLRDDKMPVKVMLSVTGKDYMPVPFADVKYKLAGNDTSVITAIAKTDKAGQLIFTIPKGKNVISAQIDKNKNTQYLNLALPDKNQVATVRFFPESGGLINKLVSTVGWEVTTPANEPLKVVGFLYENDKIIDTIQTNLYGMGKFSLLPKLNQIYTVRLKNITQKDTVYKLPTVETTGLNLVMTKALANDTVSLQIQSTSDRQVYLQVHNFRQEFVNMPVFIKAYEPRRVKIVTDSLPRGVSCISLADTDGRQLAERMFFAHFEKKPRLILKTDKDIYSTREKVTLSINLSTANAPQKIGLVSVACVQANRLEIKKFNDIETYTYLKSNFKNLPIKENYFNSATEDRSFLEQVLLIKGWHKYEPPNSINSKISNDTAHHQSVIFSGVVSLNDKPLKKAVSFVISRDSTSTLSSTDAFGNFTVDPQQITTDQDAKIRLLIGTKQDFHINYIDPYKLLNAQLAKSFIATIYEKGISTLSTTSFALTGFQKTIQLKEVKVTASKGDTFYGANKTWGANRCGDYVCEFNILNCPNHVYSNHYTPVVGRTYISNGAPVIYRGCSEETNKGVQLIEGIFLSKQFSGSDYSVANPTEPEYVSTIYWNHLTQIDDEKPANLTFYTSDITGKYKIIVQGITDDGVVYGQSYITINKK